MTIALAVEGEADRDRVFESLLEMYEERVLRLCYAILEDRPAAEDAAQEAFVRIWKALPRFRGDAAVSTWIYSVARNTALTRLARERKHPREKVREVPAPAAAETPDVEPLLARLPENYRRVLRLYYLEEKSYEQVAAALGIPLGTVKTHLHRAKKMLAEMMGYGSAR
jgi:RNA polymerase sigma-70 factor (ECF subfamily)